LPFGPQNEHTDPKKSFDSKRKSPQHRCCGLDWRRWRKYATIEDVKTDLYRYIELFYNRKLSAELQAVPHSRLYESRGIPSRKLAVSPSKRRRDFSVFRSATLHVGPKNRKKRRSIDVVSYDFGCFYAG
jgi:hypothetical protein